MNDVHISPGRARRRDERADGILAAASALLSAKGLDALTLQRLANELGYVPAALYRYFASKDALLAALQRRTIVALHAEMQEATERASAQAHALRLDSRSRALLELVTMADLYLSLPTRAPEHFRLISVLLADPRPLLSAEEAKKTAPSLFAFLGDVRDSLERAGAAKALAAGDALDRTLVLWSALQGAAQLSKIRRFDSQRFDPLRLGRASLRTLLLGWGAPRAALERAFSTAAAPLPDDTLGNETAPKRSSGRRGQRSKDPKRRSATLEHLGRT